MRERDDATRPRERQIERIRRGSSVRESRYNKRSQPQGQDPVTSPESAVRLTTEPPTSDNENDEGDKRTST